MNKFPIKIMLLISLLLFIGFTSSELIANKLEKNAVGTHYLQEEQHEANGKSTLESRDQFYYPFEHFQSGVHGVELGDRFSYTRQLSRQVITELQDLSVRLQHSIDNEKYPCESYYDYVCGRQRPLFTTLGEIRRGAQDTSFSSISSPITSFFRTFA